VEGGMRGEKGSGWKEERERVDNNTRACVNFTPRAPAAAATLASDGPMDG